MMGPLVSANFLPVLSRILLPFALKSSHSSEDMRTETNTTTYHVAELDADFFF